MEFLFGRVKWRLLDEQVRNEFEGTFKDYLKLIPQIVNKVGAEKEVLLSTRHHIARKRYEDYEEVKKKYDGKVPSPEDYIFTINESDDDESDSEIEDDPDEREQIENLTEDNF